MLAPQALDALPEKDSVALTSHLDAGCGPCRKALADFRAVAVGMALAVPPVAPPPRVKARLLARVSGGGMFAFPWKWALAAGVFLSLGTGTYWLAHRAPVFRVAGMAGAPVVDGQALRAGAALRAGQILSTGPGEHADILLPSRIAFRLGPAAEVFLRRDRGGWTAVLHRGGLFARVITGTPFTVRTPAAEVAARGTLFYVRAESAQKTYACICRGKYHLEAPGFSRDMSGEHHNAVTLLSSPAGTRVEPAGMSGHTDPEASALEAYFPTSSPPDSPRH
jgi:hypothetical protein